MLVRLSMLSILTSTLLLSDNLSNTLSFQGYTGLINTPNAEVLDNGTAMIHFNNQFDNNLRNYDYSKDIKYEENYIFGIGFLPSLEIVGRLVEAKDYFRDLSVNIKYKIPYESKYFPNIAVGLQDFGGSFNLFDNKYIVADKDIGFFKFSLGYAKAGNVIKAKRMDGVFGGVEVNVIDWLSIVAEDDTNEKHAGVKVSIPNSLVSSFNMEAILARNLTSDENSLGINLILPLGENKKELNREFIKSVKHKKKNNSFIQKQVEKKLTSISESHNDNKVDILLDLQKKLANFGFENVRVGEYGDKVIYVECENSIFDYNDLDALGYILGTVVDSDLDYNYYTVTLLKNKLQTISISGTLLSYKKYIYHPTAENLHKLKDILIIDSSFDTSKVNFLTKTQNSSLFKPKVELSLGLITTVGTEYGVFDYLASLRTNVYIPLYKGLIVSAMYESPFANSHNFDDGEVYNMMYHDKVDSRLVNANIHQTLHYDNLYNTISVGKFESDYYGILNQSYLSLFGGEHALTLKMGTFENQDVSDDTHNIYEGAYRYYYKPLDLFTTISYGNYWNDDSGVTLEVKRFFSDTSVSFIYQNLTNQYIGARVSFPFTFRKLSKPTSFGQIKGKNDFNYGIRTTVNLDDGTNRLLPDGGKMIKSDFILENYYLNRDRLNESYILNNIERMRESYLLYK